jgi:hypothetical protein
VNWSLPDLGIRCALHDWMYRTLLLFSTPVSPWRWVHFEPKHVRTWKRYNIKTEYAYFPKALFTNSFIPHWPSSFPNRAHSIIGDKNQYLYPVESRANWLANNTAYLMPEVIKWNWQWYSNLVLPLSTSAICCTDSHNIRRYCFAYLPSLYANCY